MPILPDPLCFLNISSLSFSSIPSMWLYSESQWRRWRRQALPPCCFVSIFISSAKVIEGPTSARPCAGMLVLGTTRPTCSFFSGLQLESFILLQSLAFSVVLQRAIEIRPEWCYWSWAGLSPSCLLVTPSCPPLQIRFIKPLPIPLR